MVDWWLAALINLANRHPVVREAALSTRSSHTSANCPNCSFLASVNEEEVEEEDFLVKIDNQLMFFHFCCNSPQNLDVD